MKTINVGFYLGHSDWLLCHSIFKRGDEDNIENYRPISLTNVDYRILAFTLAQRMHKIIGSTV